MQTSLSSYYPISKGHTTTSVVNPQKRLKLSVIPRSIEPPAASIHTAPESAAVTQKNEQAALDMCPVEVIELIASYLESDQDIKNLRVTCRHIHYNIEGHNGSFWRVRFLASFDQPHQTLSNAEYKKLYQARKNMLTTGATFRLAYSPQEVKCLQMMKNMVVESYTEYNRGVAVPSTESKNIDCLIRFAQSHAILDAVFNPYNKPLQDRNGERPPHPLLHVIQTLLAPCLLSHNFGTDAYCYPESQQAAFSATPWLGGAYGLNIDMELLLRQISYWRYHIVHGCESLFNAFEDLDNKDKPRFWKGQLAQGQKPKIGKRWKGAYAFCDDLEEVLEIRRGNNTGENGDDFFQECFNGEEESPDEFQDLRLELQTEGESTWPTFFEEVLHSLKQPQPKVVTRSQKASIPADERDQWASQSFRFAGEGADARGDVFYDGWFNPLPPQEGVPGWHRMTMMKYQTLDEEGGIDFQTLYAYEGIVLPGGQILVGRWWNPYGGYGEEMYSGPFIMWCVDDEEDEIAAAAT